MMIDRAPVRDRSAFVFDRHQFRYRIVERSKVTGQPSCSTDRVVASLTNLSISVTVAGERVR